MRREIPTAFWQRNLHQNLMLNKDEPNLATPRQDPESNNLTNQLSAQIQ